MELPGHPAHLELWDDRHIPGLLRHANGAPIGRYLGTTFPQPYTQGDAERWIAQCRDLPEPRTRFAIVVDGEACGGIGLERQPAERAHTWHIGYWLGEAHWGRGIATATTRVLVDWAFKELPCHRIFTFVFRGNEASVRVLEKNGFDYEGCMREHIFKDGRYYDALFYGRLPAR